MNVHPRLIVTAAAAVFFTGLVAGCGADGRVERAAGATVNVEQGPAPAGAPFARLDPAAFEQRMKNEQAMVINVHIPYEGELDGTDAFIPYDKIKNDPRLPKDKNTEILLYCRTGGARILPWAPQADVATCRPECATMGAHRARRAW